MMWRKKFFRFLKEKGVFQLYIDNINEQHPGLDYIFWEKMWKNEVLSEENKCIEGIDYAFYWDDTRQAVIVAYDVEKKIFPISKRRRSISIIY